MKPFYHCITGLLCRCSIQKLYLAAKLLLQITLEHTTHFCELGKTEYFLAAHEYLFKYLLKASKFAGAILEARSIFEPTSWVIADLFQFHLSREHQPYALYTFAL